MLVLEGRGRRRRKLKLLSSFPFMLMMLVVRIALSSTMGYEGEADIAGQWRVDQHHDATHDYARIRGGASIRRRLQGPGRNDNCTIAMECSTCLNLMGDCVWCPSENSCLTVTACPNPDQSCPPNYVYVVVIWLVLSAMLCLCCLTCTTRRCIREWRGRLGPGQGANNGLYDPLLNEDEERAEIYRNSLAEGGEDDWSCAVCAFDNRPRMKTCCLCGTSREVAIALALKWGLNEASASTAVAAASSEDEEAFCGAMSPSVGNREGDGRCHPPSSSFPMHDDEEEGGGVDKPRSMSLNITITNDKAATSPAKAAAASGHVEDEDIEREGGSSTTSGIQSLSPSAHVAALGSRRVNQLTLRQKSARRRKLWQRRAGPDGRLIWMREETPMIDDSAVSASQESHEQHQASPMQRSGSFFGFGRRISRRQRRGRRQQRSRGASFFGLVGGGVGGDEEEEEEQEQEEGLSPAAATAATRATGALGRGGYWGSSPTRRSFIDRKKEKEEAGRDVEAFKDDSSRSLPSPAYISLMGDREGLIEWLPASIPLPAPSAPKGMRMTSAWKEMDLPAVAALPFRKKHYWFADQMSKIQRPWSDGHIRLDISRTTLLEDSFGQVMSLHPCEMRQWMRVQFLNEPGVDAGGIEREWFILVTQALTEPALGLFVSQHGSYAINPGASTAMGEHLALQYYYFAGRVFGKAVMEHQTLPVHLSLPLLKHLLGTPMTFSDLEIVDPELYRSLTWIRENQQVSVLHLDFTVTMEVLGQRQVVELKAGGSKIALTDDNKEEYIALILKHRLLDSVKRPVWQLLRGFNEAVPRELLSVFDYQELELLMCGLPVIDVADWKRHTEYLGQYLRFGEKHHIIRWFWEVVEGMEEDQRARLLQFTTGACNVPAQGFKALQSNDGNFRRFNIQSVRRQECLFPRAHTCFNKLDLPLYDSKEELEGYLTLVINMEITGFTMD